MPNAFTHLRPDAIIDHSIVWDKLVNFNGGVLNVPAHILPSQKDIYNIGKADQRWNSIYSIKTYADEFIGGSYTGTTYTGTNFIGDHFIGHLQGTADNSSKLLNRVLVDSNNVFGKIPWIDDNTGEVNLGRYIDFHYDNTSNIDYSTRLIITGNNKNTITLPSIDGTIALISNIDTLRSDLTSLINNVKSELSGDISNVAGDVSNINIPNGTLTIQKNGVTVGSFNVNTDKTINIAIDENDLNTTYTLKKEGNIVSLIDSNGKTCGSFTDAIGAGGDGDTTYTFTSGTNSFTVKPSNGEAQVVTVTPQINEASTSNSGLMSSGMVQDLNNLKTTVAGHTTSIDGHTNDINTINGKITSIESNITNLTNSSSGFNTSTTVTALPIDKKYVFVEMSGNGSFSLNSLLSPGYEIHVIINNTGSSDIQISIPNNSEYVNFTDDALTIGSGSYAEINVVANNKGVMFIRSAN